MANANTGFSLFPTRLALLFVCLGLFLDPSSSFARKPEKAVPAVESAKAGTLEIRCFNVGKGDAILLRLPNGRFAMIDTGWPETSQQLIADLRKLGVGTIDLLVLTHHDKDHVGGYPHLLEAFEIKRVVQSYDPRDKKKTLLVKPGTVILDEAGVKMTVLAPFSSHKDENDASLVTRLTFGSNSILFTGDIVEEAQNALLEREVDLRADLLKVPHHGRYSGFSPRALFKAVTPSFAIITCDEKAGDPPENSVLRMLQEMGVEVLRTDRVGTVTFVSDGKNLRKAGAGQD